MSKDRRFRVLVTVTETHHPELFDQLACVPKEARAERLRALGSVPLMNGVAVNAQPDNQANHEPTDADIREALMSGVVGQFDAR